MTRHANKNEINTVTKFDEMDSKANKDVRTLSTKCLALVFRERKSRTQRISKSVEGAEAKPNNIHIVKSAESLFEAFIEENGCCYWNPHLEESIKNLKFEGHISPLTLLVTGRDIYLDTVKSAWTRRAIQCPKGFALLHIGEIPTIEMAIVPQTQFAPLPEALCIIIADLTKTSKDASFDAVLECLKDKYRGMQQPSETVVYEMLGTLIKEHKIYHTGSGYHLVTPDMYQPGGKSITLQDHHLVIGGTDTPNGLTPTIYIPLLNPSGNADMVSISCQTETSTNLDSTDPSLNQSLEKEEKPRGGGAKLERGHSVRESKKGRKEKREDREFARGSSLRYSEEKAKGTVKDINLRTSDVHQDKDKGEKASLLSKLFGRNKAKDSVPTTECDTDEGPQVEYATFSAQFPPPEWQWYENQVTQVIESQRQIPKKSLAKSSTWHHAARRSMLTDPETQSDTDDVYDEICVHANDCPVSRARTLPSEFPPPSMDDTSPKVPPSCSSQSDSWSSMSDLPVKPPYQPPARHPHRPSKHRQRHSVNVHDFSRSSGAYESFHAEGCVPNNQVRPKDTYQEYSTQDDQRKSSAEESRMLNNATDSTPARPSHVTKVFKKYRQMKCPSIYNNDISVEYKGKMPKKGSALSMSRDSGVNCIGLGANKHQPKPQLFGKKHYNTETDLDGQQLPPSSNIPDPGSGVLHQALIHTHPGASPEDSGFNSPKALVESPSPHTPGSDVPNHYGNTPDRVSPEQYNHKQDNWDEVQHTGIQSPEAYDNAYHHHYHHHHYLPQDKPSNPDLTELANGNPRATGWDTQGEGSTNNMWSDTTSERTVREVKSAHSQAAAPSAPDPQRRSSSSPPAVRRETSPLRQAVRRTEPFREIHLVPENSRTVHKSHPSHDKVSSHHRRSHKDSSRPSKPRQHRGKAAPGKQRPLPGLSGGERTQQASGRCPTRRYPSENTYTHRVYRGESDDSCDPPPPRDYSVVGVI